MRLMLGDRNHNGRIDVLPPPPEAAVSTEPYILWSAGPNEVFGIDLTNAAGDASGVWASSVPSCDDATTFTN